MADLDLNQFSIRFLDDADTRRALETLTGLNGRVIPFGSVVVDGVEPNDIDLLFLPAEWNGRAHHDELTAAGFAFEDTAYGTLGYKFRRYLLGHVDLHAPWRQAYLGAAEAFASAVVRFRYQANETGPFRRIARTRDGRIVMTTLMRKIAEVEALANGGD